MKTKWEYKLVEATSAGLRQDGAFNNAVRMADQANELGREGWELCAVTADGGGFTYFFKRPLENQGV